MMGKEIRNKNVVISESENRNAPISEHKSMSMM